MIHRSLQFTILMLLVALPTFSQRLMVIDWNIDAGGATTADMAERERAISLAEQENTNQLKMLAEELTQSLVSGNLDRFIDLTYPKAVNLLGGKEKMKQELEKGQKGMRADGYELISATIGKVGDVLKAGSERFVVVEYMLKMKVPNGYLLRDSFLIGVASIDKENWTFVDGAGLHRPEAKEHFPEIIGKFVLPTPKPPVFQQSIK